MAGPLDEGVFHFLLHLLYWVQYSALTIAVIVSFIYFQYRERKLLGGWSGLLTSHALLHLLLFIYDIIQVLRSQMALFHTDITDRISAFLYYFKDSFSIFVLCVILYVFLSNLLNEDKSKIVKIVLGIFMLVFSCATVVFAVFSLESCFI